MQHFRSAALKRIGVLVTECVLLSAFALVATQQPAAAAPTAPHAAWSWYVRYPYNKSSPTDTSSNAYKLGCDQGTADANNGNRNSELFVDFGAQNSANTGNILPLTNTSVSYTNVEHYAESFAYGYWICTGSDLTSTLYLAMGTNNSIPDNVDSAHGSSWANVAKTVTQWTVNNTVASQVTIYGGDDIEPAYASQSRSVDWANGYNSVSSRPFYIDFGSCDGCPTSATTGNGYTFYPCSGCSAWNQYGVWKVSWGEPSALALPEIYGYPQQHQWSAISYYGKIAQSSSEGEVRFEGPLDEYDLDSSTYTSAQAWTNFWNALNGDFSGAVAQTPGWASEVHKTSS
jgi:hypothetical protein